MTERERTRQAVSSQDPDRTRTSWSGILTQIAIIYVLIYTSLYYNLPFHEYLRFLPLIPLYRAAVTYGYAGGILGGIVVTLLFLPVIPLDAQIRADRYGVYSAVALLLVINGFGIAVGGIIGSSRRMRANVQRLSALSLAIARAADEPGVMQSLAAAAMDLVEARHALYAMRAPDGGEDAVWHLRALAANGEAADLGACPADHPLAWCAENREALAANGVAADPRFAAPLNGAAAAQSLLAVPVASGQRAVGAILVADKRSEDRFTGHDMSMLRVLARTAASAMGNIEQERRRQRERLREEQMKDLFGRFVSSSVAEFMLENPESLQGRWQEVTVLVSDIRGFTAMSESLSPHEIVDRLNEYFTCMVDVIFERRGAIDKFIGDCIIAYWGAPAPDDDHTRHAAEAAVEMAAALDSLNERWRARGLAPFRAGIGLHTCQALIGNLGDERKKAFTILGPEVRKAMNIEALTKEYDVRIVVSEPAAACLDGLVTLERLPAHAGAEYGALYRVVP